jgi:hypothetical protein
MSAQAGGLPRLRMQPKREFDSNKRKQMKINDSKIAFFYLRLFLKSGLFNGLRPIQIEFFLPLSGTRSGCIGAERTPSCRSTARPEGFRQSSLASPSILTKISALRKKNVGELWNIRA